ncbi:proline-rich transmembrane protein 1 [Biomphalaria pfeifferi]|uniref:Proline-rich transmembrane protein 1 n=1 Tax=Biomphalaria pfeifferi TaxID=112525 RepID=A0AAD8F2R6_BIOPF|nr:proline-rich transmembrane protein 1 [Biomphalaria pfeifferi]
MEEKGLGLPPSYDATHGVSNPTFDTIYSPPMSEPTVSPPYYGHSQPAYGNVVSQQPMVNYTQVTTVPDNMTLAILSLLCCWPLGIAAIMKASDSRAALARNDIPTALADANDAKRYSCLGIGFGVFSVVVTVIILVVVFTTLNIYSY